MAEPEAVCGVCGEPMPPGEEMFTFHGYSGPCPKPPLPKVVEPDPGRTLLVDAWQDIRDWVAFAERQMREIPDWDRLLYGPGTSGVNESKALLEKISAHLRTLDPLPPEDAAAPGRGKIRCRP